ncbi:MAG: mechanosensitive ion channel, partial [Flavobacteriaceae bacterium]|nr:mechanosensitive ion channel [Flavobacteriaceae bacterium]
MGPLYKFSNILKEDSELVLKSIHKVLKIIAFFLWIYVILGLLKIRKTIFSSFTDFINSPLEVGELSISLANIISFFIILQVTIWISQFISYFLDREVYPRTHLSKGVSSTFSLMIKYSLTFFGFLIALFGAGIEISKVAVGIGALGVGIGFGLQNIINNFVSGIILALERPIKIGDIVKIDDIEGEVKDIGLRA